jgi:molybdopterin-containing oxidoreductase family membrane subunit
MVSGALARRHADIETAAFRPIERPGRWFWPVAIFLTLVVAGALAAYAYQLLSGMWVAGYSDRAFYGIYEANLVAFIGVSYGGALVSAVLRLSHASWRAPVTRIAEAMALVSLVVGGAFAIVHVGRPERLWQILVAPQFSSPIVWDFAAISTYLVATIFFLYLPLIPDLATARDRLAASAHGWRHWLYRTLALGWRDEPRQRRRLEYAVGGLAILIIPLAVSVHSVLAWAFSMTSRAGWHSTIFGPYFVIGALYSGVALVIVLAAAFRSAYRLQPFIGVVHFSALARIMGILGLAYLYFTFSELLTAGYVRTREEVSIVAVLLEGAYAIPFWGFLIGGLLVPIVIAFVPATQRIRWLVAAAALAVVGMWLKRVLITLPSATAPLIGESWGTVQLTWVPILITAGATAAIPLGLMVLFRLVPIMSVDEMRHATAEEDRPATIGQELRGAEGGIQ